MAAWAETEIVLAADLGDGTDDPRATAPDLLRRALTALPAAARAGQVGLRADAGYFAGALARAAHDARIAFAIGAKRIAPLWRLLDGIAEDAWHNAIDMDGAQPGERANAQLKMWRILRKLRCCPWRAGQLAKAIHALQIHGA